MNRIAPAMRDSPNNPVVGPLAPAPRLCGPGGGHTDHHLPSPGRVAGHVTSYVYVRDDGIDGNIPPHVAMISPGVRRNSLPLADHRLHLDLKIRELLT